MSRDAWPKALHRLMDEAGVAGAALIVTNKTMGTVDERRSQCRVQIPLRRPIRRARSIFAISGCTLEHALQVSSRGNFAEKRVVQRVCTELRR